MPSNQALSSEELEQYRMRLRGTRDQLDGEIDKVVDSLRAELGTSGNLSTVPVHMGDIAPEQVDADIDVIETERGMMEAIQAALHRIDDGTFGKCTDCGEPIGRERLEAVPYTPHCIRCAKKRS